MLHRNAIDVSKDITGCKIEREPLPSGAERADLKAFEVGHFAARVYIAHGLEIHELENVPQPRPLGVEYLVPVKCVLRPRRERWLPRHNSLLRRRGRRRRSGASASSNQNAQ